jgi:hypothetical protein
MSGIWRDRVKVRVRVRVRARVRLVRIRVSVMVRFRRGSAPVSAPRRYLAFVMSGLV